MIADRPRDHLGVHHRVRGVRLCRDGRLRPRARHPVSAVSRQSRPRRDHEQRRAGLGRQRNLAGARRRRHDGGVSAGLCGADARALHARDRDADRPDLPRRRVRIPLAHHAERAQSLGHRIRRRLVAGGAGAGNCARRHPAGRACRGPALCRRLVGLADAVQHPDRACARGRLRASGRDLAGAEDRRRAARQGLSA